MQQDLENSLKGVVVLHQLTTGCMGFGLILSSFGMMELLNPPFAWQVGGAGCAGK